jgi:hypothetical protein
MRPARSDVPSARFVFGHAPLGFEHQTCKGGMKAMPAKKKAAKKKVAKKRKK